MAPRPIIIGETYRLWACLEHVGFHSTPELGQLVRVTGVYEPQGKGRDWVIQFHRRRLVPRPICTASGCCLHELEEGELVVCLLAE